MSKIAKISLFLQVLLRKQREPRKKAWFFFCIDWEQRKLGDLVERVVRKNTNNESTLPLTISAQYGLVDQFTYFNNRVASRDVSNYYLLYKGEFAYNKSTSDGFPFGTVKRLDFYEKGVLSTLYIVFSIKKENLTDSNFLTVFFDTDRWHKGISERAAEGARNHGLLNISADDFFDIDLTIPKNKNEQTAIGKFIRCLDDLITLHQREQKYLYLIFEERKIPQKMANDWEQRKVSELSEKTYGGGTPSTQNEGFWSGEIPWIQSSDIEEGRLYGVTPRKFISQDGLNQSAAQLIPKNSIAIITRVGVGKLAFMPFSYATSQDFVSLSRLTVDPFFTVYACYRRLQTDLNSVQGTSIKGITKEELLSKVILFPDEPEQRLIGGLFRRLDDLITLHQRKRKGEGRINLNPHEEGEQRKNANDWEQRKLGEIAKVRTGYPFDSSTFDPNGEWLVITNGNIQDDSPTVDCKNGNRINIDDPVLLNYVLDNDDILITMDGTVGRVAKVAQKGLILAQRVGRLSTYGNSEFIYHLLSAGTFSDAMIEIAHGGTIRHISLSEIADFNAQIPKSDKEQELIGSFFRSLDNLITLHQCKDMVVQYEKNAIGGNGEKQKVANDWEQRKVSNMFKITRGTVLAASLTNERKTAEMPYPVYSSQTKERGLMGYYKDYLYEDAITWTTDGANAGTVNFRAGKFYCTNVCGVLLTDKFIANQAIAEAINNVAKKYVSYVGNPKLMNNVMADIEITIPTSDHEREKMSAFFTRLDDLITLHQRE